MRTSASFLALLLLPGIVAAAPASATYGVIVQLPAGAAYSPFAGPATVTFTFLPTDPSDVFRIRIRQAGQQAAIKYKDYLVDPDDPDLAPSRPVRVESPDRDEGDDLRRGRPPSVRWTGDHERVVHPVAAARIEAFGVALALLPPGRGRLPGPFDPRVLAGGRHRRHRRARLPRQCVWALLRHRGAHRRSGSARRGGARVDMGREGWCGGRRAEGDLLREDLRHGPERASR